MGGPAISVIDGRLGGPTSGLLNELECGPPIVELDESWVGHLRRIQTRVVYTCG